MTDIQQQSSKISSNNNGKSTPPPQQTSSTSSGTTTDVTNIDPITQAILMLEKKQRNLGKRKVFISLKNISLILTYLLSRKNLKVMNKKPNLVKNLIKIKRFYFNKNLI